MTINNDNSLPLLELIDSSEVVAYRPALGRALRSANAALFLCQAIYWHRISLKMGNDCFFKLMEAERDSAGNMIPPSAAHKQSWEWELGGMSRREQETARKILLKFKLINEKRKSIPAKLYFSVNIGELEKFIIKNQQIVGNVQSIMAESDNQDVRKEPVKNGAKRQSITKNTPEIITKNISDTQRTLCRSKIICENLMKMGIKGVSANNPLYLKLLTESNWDQEFEAIAAGLQSGQMQFEYILAKVKGRREDALKIMANS